MASSGGGGGGHVPLRPPLGPALYLFMYLHEKTELQMQLTILKHIIKQFSG